MIVRASEDRAVATSTDTQATTPAMRWMLYVAGVFVIIAGFQLFVLGERTEDFFAWTIDAPLTAAFLGAGYWSSAVLELGSARRREWSRARLAMPAVLFFTTITLALTLVHIDRFHLDGVFGVAWLAVYVGFPVAMAMILFFQLRAAGAEAPRRAALPGWLRVALSGQATVMVALGAVLYIAPLDAAAIWPWPLTPLTGRAIGAWLLGTGFLAAHMAIENARERVDVAMLSYAAFGGMQLVAVARYSSTPDWNALGAAAYLGFLAAMVGLGLYGWFIGRGSALEHHLTRPRRFTGRAAFHRDSSRARRRRARPRSVAR